VVLIELLGILISSFTYSKADYGIKLGAGIPEFGNIRLYLGIERQGEFPSEGWFFNINNWCFELRNEFEYGTIYMVSTFDFSPQFNFQHSGLKMSLGIGPTLGVEWESFKHKYLTENVNVEDIIFKRLGGGHFQFILRAEDSHGFTGEGIFKFRYLRVREKRETIYEKDGVKWKEPMWNYHYDFVFLTLALFVGRQIEGKVYELGGQLEVYYKLKAVCPLGAIAPFPSLFARIRF
jgi:hypothetical protein